MAALGLTELGLVAPSKVCAGGNCQAFYCDRGHQWPVPQAQWRWQLFPHQSHRLRGQLLRRQPAAAAAAPVLMAKPTVLRPDPAPAAVGPIITGVRGSDCCGGSSKKTPTPAPTPTPPPCDGERIDVRKPRGSYEQDPPHATVVGQDPTVRGFDLEIDLQGGRAERWTMETKQLCDTWLRHVSR